MHGVRSVATGHTQSLPMLGNTYCYRRPIECIYRVHSSKTFTCHCRRSLDQVWPTQELHGDKRLYAQRLNVLKRCFMSMPGVRFMQTDRPAWTQVTKLNVKDAIPAWRSEVSVAWWKLRTWAMSHSITVRATSPDTRSCMQVRRIKSRPVGTLSRGHGLHAITAGPLLWSREWTRARLFSQLHDVGHKQTGYSRVASLQPLRTVVYSNRVVHLSIFGWKWEEAGPTQTDLLL